MEALLPKRYGGENGWGTVYRHLGFLEVTRRAVEARSTVEVPSGCRALNEAVYHEERLGALREESVAWEKHFQDMEGDVDTHEIIARQTVVDFDTSYIGHADRFNRDLSGPVRTRLGDDRVRVRLPAPLPGVYAPASTANHADLPWEKLREIGDPNRILEDPHASGGRLADGINHYDLHGFTFRYTPQ